MAGPEKVVAVASVLVPILSLLVPCVLATTQKDNDCHELRKWACPETSKKEISKEAWYQCTQGRSCFLTSCIISGRPTPGFSCWVEGWVKRPHHWPVKDTLSLPGSLSEANKVLNKRRQRRAAEEMSTTPPGSTTTATSKTTGTTTIAPEAAVSKATHSGQLPVVLQMIIERHRKMNSHAFGRGTYFLYGFDQVDERQRMSHIIDAANNKQKVRRIRPIYRPTVRPTAEPTTASTPSEEPPPPDGQEQQPVTS